MFFHSVDFAIFFLVVWSLVRVTRDQVAIRNVVLLAASYTFYGWWDYRFLVLLAFSTLVDFAVGQQIDRCQPMWQRRCYLVVSLISNLGVLAFFKYFNFFIDSFEKLFGVLGFQLDYPTMQVILPVGISFYTFQTLSYTIDIYRRQIKPTYSLLQFAVYVSFFPQLVAGPIERASSFLPQVRKKQITSQSDYTVAIWLISLGYFKKIFVADNLAGSIDPIFANHHGYTSFDIWLAIVGFTIQIYCDFSGYSDIARGLARTMGFSLQLNFCLPFFATGPQDFWRRWHISLSSWLRDYVYFPMGGSRHRIWLTCRNLMATMLLGGLWHGASWNFVLWGFFHGAILTTQRCWQSIAKGRLISHQFLYVPIWIRSSIATMTFFLLMLLGWLLFRADSLQTAYQMATWCDWRVTTEVTKLATKIVFYSLPLLLLEIGMLRSGDLLAPLKLNWINQSALLVAMWGAIATLGYHGTTSFIYFQF